MRGPGTVRALRGIAVDLRSVASSIGATVARARRTFRSNAGTAAGTCEVPGCGAPATHPCICDAIYCADHYATALDELDADMTASRE